MKKLTLEMFIERANKVHSGLYTYNRANYINSQTKILIDSEYGEFWQRPNDHLRGNGHPIIGQQNKVSKLSHSLKKFIVKARKVHGDLYDYSKVNYINSLTKVCIIDASTLQEKWITPKNHLIV